jgi:hypothetical protein
MKEMMGNLDQIRVTSYESLLNNDIVRRGLSVEIKQTLLSWRPVDYRKEELKEELFLITTSGNSCGTKGLLKITGL